MDSEHLDTKREFDFMESGDDISLETTVPTDISLSLDEDFKFSDKKARVSRHQYEKKRLLHDIQVLKIELSQKGLMLDNIKADHMQKIDELEEKLSEALHQKQLLQARLESQLKIQQQDAGHRTDQIQKELDTILKRQQHLEVINGRLQETAADIRKDLKSLELTENQYNDLRLKHEDELTLRDCVGKNLYEAVRPWKAENSELKSRCKNLSDELYHFRGAYEKSQDGFECLKREHNELESKFQRLTLTYADVKAQVHQDNYKIENYDRVKKERDDLDADHTDIRKNYTYLEAAHQAMTKERDGLSSELVAAKQSINLLDKDKDFFSKQVSELHNKLLYNEDKVVQFSEQLERAKASREELYDKYVASRDQYKMEYESKLREELDLIRVRTNSEIDRLKTSTKEMYERENRGLREARDMTIREKEQAQASERDANAKYDKLLQEYRQLQMSNDSKISDVQNDFKLKAFEVERTQLLYEETSKNLKECQVENEKQQKKLEVLTKEYYSLQMNMEKQVTELETELSEKKIKLETYEKLEVELDQVIMQAAEVEDESDAEKVLFSYGYGANVPTNAKRRLKQSVHLAKRVLQLEKENTTLRKDFDQGIERNKKLADEIKNVNSILDHSQQPSHYLVESIRLRDAQLSQQTDHIALLEGDVERQKRQILDQSKAKNQLASDLERLLNQREEMTVMKQVVLSMSQQHGPASHVISDPEITKPTRTTASKSNRSKSKAKTIHRGYSDEPAERDENVHKPLPTEFTVSNPPDWYSRLKHKPGKVM